MEIKTYIFKLFILGIILCSFTKSYGQIDSLFNVLENNIADTTNVGELINTLEKDLYENPKGLLINCERLIELTEGYNNKFQNAEILNLYGLALYVNEQFDQSIPALLQALDLFTEIDSKQKIARVTNSLGTVYGRIDPDISETYYEKALEMYTVLKDTLWIASLAGNLGLLHLGNKEYKESEKYYEESYNLSSKIHRPLLAGVTSSNYGLLKVKLGEYQEAIDLSLTALDLVPYSDLPLLHGSTNLVLGEAYLELGKMSLAKKSLTKAYDVSKEVLNNEHMSEAARLLSIFNEKNGNFKEALKYEKEWVSFRDSIISEEEFEKMADAIQKYEGEKKAQQIELLSAENEIKDLKIQKGKRNIGLALLGLLALSIISFLIYRSRRKFSQLNNILTEQKALITESLEEKEVLLKEIHHRVKNNLQIVSSLLGLQSRFVDDSAAKDAIQTGRARVQSMSLLHQKLYKNKDLKSIKVQDYFEDMVHNLFNNYKLTDKNITLETDFDDISLDVDVMVPIGLIANELISNALKHAYTDQKEGVISIKMHNQKEKIIFEVRDNGKGIDLDKVNIQDESLGMQLIHSFASKLDADLKFDNEQGTTVKLVLDKAQLAAQAA